MDLTRIVDTIEHVPPVHSALDLVNDTLYVSVRVPTTTSTASMIAPVSTSFTPSTTELVVLTSNGDALGTAGVLPVTRWCGSR